MDHAEVMTEEVVVGGIVEAVLEVESAAIGKIEVAILDLITNASSLKKKW